MLIKDYPPIAKNALTMLVNLSEDSEVLGCLMEDDPFMESLLKRVTVRFSPLVSLEMDSAFATMPLRAR